MVECCQFFFCLVIRDCPVDGLFGSYYVGCVRERDIPQSVVVVAMTFKLDGSVLGDKYVGFGERGCAVIIAQFANGEKGPSVEGVEDVTGFGSGCDR